ncbi:MAG: LytTR family transcriptional regulator [Clostridia bacterium]|nr:LytTR family transcriptional regulator [Clostridia bacterium]
MNLTCVSIKDGAELIFKENRKEVSVPLCDVVFFESCGHYITIHMNSGKPHSTRCTMTELAKLLSDSSFVRVHRGIIVNLSYVKRIDCKGAVLNSPWDRLPVGRTFKLQLKERFGKL